MASTPPEASAPSRGQAPPAAGARPRDRLSRRRVLALALAGGAAGGVVMLGGAYWAWRPGGYLTNEARSLRALKHDPMGAQTILGHTAVHTEEPDISSWKTPAIILARYFRDEATSPQDLRDQLITYATHHGWKEDTTHGTETADNDAPPWVARHTDREPDDFMQLIISEITPKKPEYPSSLHGTVRVSLSYNSVCETDPDGNTTCL